MKAAQKLNGIFFDLRHRLWLERYHRIGWTDSGFQTTQDAFMFFISNLLLAVDYRIGEGYLYAELVREEEQ